MKMKERTFDEFRKAMLSNCELVTTIAAEDTNEGKSSEAKLLRNLIQKCLKFEFFFKIDMNKNLKMSDSYVRRNFAFDEVIHNMKGTIQYFLTDHDSWLPVQVNAIEIINVLVSYYEAN
jgi:hypothetical protein